MPAGAAPARWRGAGRRPAEASAGVCGTQSVDGPWFSSWLRSGVASQYGRARAYGSMRARTRARMDSHLTALTFNIRTDRGLDGLNSWWFRRSATVDVIRAVAPDVVALQEVRRLQLGYLVDHLPDYEFVGRGVGRGRGKGRTRGEHCPVLFRPDRFVLDDWCVRWFGEHERGRSATFVR